MITIDKVKPLNRLWSRKLCTLCQRVTNKPRWIQRWSYQRPGLWSGYWKVLDEPMGDWIADWTLNFRLNRFWSRESCTSQRGTNKSPLNSKVIPTETRPLIRLLKRTGGADWRLNQSKCASCSDTAFEVQIKRWRWHKQNCQTWPSQWDRSVSGTAKCRPCVHISLEGFCCLVWTPGEFIRCKGIMKNDVPITFHILDSLIWG